VLLLVDSLLQCSLDASVVVTDASVSDVRIFIILQLGGAAVVSTDWVALASLWEAPTIHIFECHYHSAYTIIISLNKVIWTEFIWGGGILR
jgi:hypothetical protein